VRVVDLVARELHDERIDQLDPFRPDRSPAAVTTANRSKLKELVNSDHAGQRAVNA
jgi:hypothetical protein